MLHYSHCKAWTLVNVIISRAVHGIQPFGGLKESILHLPVSLTYLIRGFE